MPGSSASALPRFRDCVLKAASLSHAAVAGLLTVLHASIDMTGTLLGDTHYLLYALSAASAFLSLLLHRHGLTLQPVAVQQQQQ